MNFAAVSETHFNFGGVDVDIDAGGVHLHIQHIDRLTLTVQHIFVGAACTMRDDFVAHKSPIDISKLLIGSGPCHIGYAGTAAHMHRA